MAESQSRTYQPRAIRFLEPWEASGVRLKVYGILHRGDAPPPALLEGAKQVAAAWLEAHPTRQLVHGVGFLGVHDGRTENQVFLDRWINHNELLHTYWVSPKDRPTDLRPPADPVDHNTVCVWDLAVQCF